MSVPPSTRAWFATADWALAALAFLSVAFGWVATDVTLRIATANGLGMLLIGALLYGLVRHDAARLVITPPFALLALPFWDCGVLLLLGPGLCLLGGLVLERFLRSAVTAAEFPRPSFGWLTALWVALVLLAVDAGMPGALAEWRILLWAVALVALIGVAIRGLRTNAPSATKGSRPEQ